MKLNFDASVDNLEDANDLIDYLVSIEKEHSIDCTLNLVFVTYQDFEEFDKQLSASFEYLQILFAVLVWHFGPLNLLQ